MAGSRATRENAPDENLAQELNAKSLSYRGRAFTPALVHTILTRETYVGRHYYNTKDGRTNTKRLREASLSNRKAHSDQTVDPSAADASSG
ncbi:recombinase family protein [Qipengyuania citrea]|uniref:Recombinase family protein n=1 Tax=Qipengyuania citrea TaxID=225971 RepID=A0ABY4U5J6_9SPHN|nr:recombinase family protein [Qipengyuania citrea]USA61383.1 recombinase family protein [Qipengyuania citrea]